MSARRSVEQFGKFDHFIIGKCRGVLREEDFEFGRVDDAVLVNVDLLEFGEDGIAYIGGEGA